MTAMPARSVARAPEGASSSLRPPTSPEGRADATSAKAGRSVAVPVRTRNPNNGSAGFSKGAAMARARERRAQRETARACVLSLGPLSLPLVVTVTRIAPSSGLDPHDGLGAALKGVIDGVADALGLRNDRDPRIAWRLDQRRGPRGAYAVELCFEQREDDPEPHEKNA